MTGKGKRLSDLLSEKNLPLRREQQNTARLQILEDRITALTAENQTLRDEAARLQQELDQQARVAAERKEGLFQLAVSAIKADNPVDAMGFLQGILFEEPENLKARLNLAAVYHELGFSGRAKEALLSVLAKDPENQIARENFQLLESEERA